MTANVGIAMLVATFKAGLVAAIFMHLSNEKQLIYRILIFTAFFVLGLFFLTYLAWYDPDRSLNVAQRFPYRLYHGLNASRAGDRRLVPLDRFDARRSGLSRRRDWLVRRGAWP